MVAKVESEDMGRASFGVDAPAPWAIREAAKFLSLLGDLAAAHAALDEAATLKGVLR